MTVHSCRLCERTFARRSYLALHLGRTHGDAVDAAELAAFEQAVADEEAWLVGFQRHVRGSLATLPIVLLFLGVILIGYLGGGSLALGLLLLPGGVGFSVLVYYLGYSQPTRAEREAEHAARLAGRDGGLGD